MKLIPLHTISQDRTYVGGEVSIHPTAAIAAGVLLQAEAGSRILIAAGACLGMGTVLHAVQGTLEIGEGANLGTGVLMVGAGQVGHHACVGAATTLFYASVPPHQIIPPGSVLGDPSRRGETMPVKDVTPEATVLSPQQPQQTVPMSSRGTTEQMSPPVVTEQTMGEVYGRTYVDELLIKLMPHRQHKPAGGDG